MNDRGVAYWVFADNWAKANCVDAPEELFFPKRITKYKVDGVRMVFCRTCILQEECVKTFLDEEDGIFGGMTLKERLVLQKVREHAGEDAFIERWKEMLGRDYVDKDWLG